MSPNTQEEEVYLTIYWWKNVMHLYSEDTRISHLHLSLILVDCNHKLAHRPMHQSTKENRHFMWSYYNWGWEPCHEHLLHQTSGKKNGISWRCHSQGTVSIFQCMHVDGGAQKTSNIKSTKSTLKANDEPLKRTRPQTCQWITTIMD